MDGEGILQTRSAVETTAKKETADLKEKLHVIMGNMAMFFGEDISEEKPTVYIDTVGTD